AGAPLVERGHLAARNDRSSKCGSTSVRAIRRSEDCEDAVADQLEYVAVLRMNRRYDDVGIIVQQRNYLLGRGIGDTREAAQVAEPDDRINPIGNAAHDAPAQQAPCGVAAEI